VGNKGTDVMSVILDSMGLVCQDKGHGAAWQQPVSLCGGCACMNEANFKGAIVL